MNGTESEGTAGILDPEYVRDSVQFVVNVHAATVNMRLYPSTSSMVTETLKKAYGTLEKLLEKQEHFCVSVVENSLLINDVRLDDTEQTKSPVKSFIYWMTERGLSSVDFMRGTTLDEIRNLLQILAELTDSQEARATLPSALSEAKVEHVNVNQRVYVAISTGEDVGDVKAGVIGGRQASPLDALKDELLIRYLMGKIDLGEVEETDVVEVLSDPSKVGGILSRFLEEEGAEGEGILVKSEKATEALEKLATMIGEVEDETLKGALSEQVSKIIAEMDPKQMTSVLAGRAPEKLDIVHVRENVIKMLSDQQLLDVVDSLIDEYEEMKEQVVELDPAWTREHLKNLNEVLLQLRSGKRGEALSEKIDERLEKAQIKEERDKATGKRVLSAFQILGGPLEEEQIPDLGEGVDENVSRQVRQLYAMGENDLAAGILLKVAAHLKSEDRSIRRYAASLLYDTWDSLEKLDVRQRLTAAQVIEPEMERSAAEEDDYQVFVFVTDCLSGIAELYIREGRADEASRILDLVSEKASPDSGVGIELAKHARRVLDGIIGPKGALSPAELLSEPDKEKRARTVRALANLGPQAIAPIIDVVKDRGQAELRQRALEAIMLCGEVGVASLLDELKEENPWYVYRNLLNVIAELRLTQAVGQIEAMASHPDERIRREAIRTLARMRASGSLRVIMNATNDSSSAVRITAVRMLGMFRDRKVGDYLVDIIEGRGPRGKEEEQGVVEAACLALGDMRNPEYIGVLSGLLLKGRLFKKGRPEEVRAAACLALGNIEAERVIQVLEKATKDPSMMVRSSAEKALKRIRGIISSPQPAAPEEVRQFREAQPPGTNVQEGGVTPAPRVSGGDVNPEAGTKPAGEVFKGVPAKDSSVNREGKRPEDGQAPPSMWK